MDTGDRMEPLQHNDVTEEFLLKGTIIIIKLFKNEFQRP